MIITFMLLNKKVLSGRRSFFRRVKYKGFAAGSVCFGLQNTCISGVLECRFGLNSGVAERSKKWGVGVGVGRRLGGRG